MFSSFRWSEPVRLSTSKRLRYPGERGPYSRYHICSNVQSAESIINLLLPQCDHDCFRCTRRQIGGARQSNFGRSKGERGSLRGTQIRRGASFHITCSTSVGTKWSSLCEAIFGLRKLLNKAMWLNQDWSTLFNECGKEFNSKGASTKHMKTHQTDLADVDASILRENFKDRVLKFSNSNTLEETAEKFNLNRRVLEDWLKIASR